MEGTIQFKLNGRQCRTSDGAERMLLWVLRTDYGLTGAKYGCGEGHCGACTVLVDGRPLRSCLTPAAAVDGKDVLTVEGLGKDGRLHPLQQAFLDHGAFQCGYCTSGMLLGAAALLAATPDPSREEIVRSMDRHLCRCGAHQRIVAAIESVAHRRKGAE